MNYIEKVNKILSDLSGVDLGSWERLQRRGLLLIGISLQDIAKALNDIAAAIRETKGTHND